MRQGLIILVTAALEVVAALNMPLTSGLLLGNIAVVTGLVGLACALGWPGLLGKRADGTVPWWSFVVFWPWHALIHGILFARRRWGREPVSTEIHPGWHVGGWPHARELWREWPAIVDMTCELPRRGPSEHYLGLPTWDATAPTIEDIERGAVFAIEQRRAGRAVLVHCAAGHGRSATVLAAALVTAGLHPDWRAAIAHMKAARPGVHLVSEQQRALDLWAESRRR